MNPKTRLLANLGVCVALLLAVANGCNTCNKFFGDGPHISLPRSQESCPSCGIPRADGCMCQVDYVCHGYNSTCWYDWPEECVDCNDMMSGQMATPEIAQPSGATDSAQEPVSEPVETNPPPVDVTPPAEESKSDADQPASPPEQAKPNKTSRHPRKRRPDRRFESFSTTPIRIKPAKVRRKVNKTTLHIEPLRVILPTSEPVISEELVLEEQVVITLQPKNADSHRLSILDQPGPLQEEAKPSGRVTQAGHLGGEITIEPTKDEGNDRKTGEEETILDISTNVDSMPLTRAVFQQPSTPAEIFFVTPAKKRIETPLGAMFRVPPRDHSERNGEKDSQSAGDLWAAFDAQ